MTAQTSAQNGRTIQLTFLSALCSTRNARNPALPHEAATSLTPRQRGVLLLIGRGLSNKYIARQLNITPETVKSHTKQILGKLNARTRAEAVARAITLSELRVDE